MEGVVALTSLSRIVICISSVSIVGRRRIDIWGKVLSISSVVVDYLKKVKSLKRNYSKANHATCLMIVIDMDDGWCPLVRTN